MFLFELLLILIIQLAMIGLDVIGFFVVVRALVTRWPVRPLLAFDQIGRPVVDPLTDAVDRALPLLLVRDLACRTRAILALTLLTIALCRLGLGSLLS